MLSTASSTRSGVRVSNGWAMLTPARGRLPRPAKHGSADGASLGGGLEVSVVWADAFAGKPCSCSRRETCREEAPSGADDSAILAGNRHHRRPRLAIGQVFRECRPAVFPRMLNPDKQGL